MARVQGSYPINPGSAEPHTPHTVEAVKVSGQFQGLELQVNIEGRDHKILLSADVLQDHGLSGPAAAEDLHGIRSALERIAQAIESDRETE